MKQGKIKSLNHMVRRMLLASLTAAFSLICVIAVIWLNIYYTYQISYVMEQQISDCRDALYGSASEYLKESAEGFANIIGTSQKLEDGYLEDSVVLNDGLAEMDLVDSEGVILSSTDNEKEGHNISEYRDMMGLESLLTDQESYADDIEELSDENNKEMIYAGYRFNDGSGFIAVATRRDQVSSLMLTDVQASVQYRSIGLSGEMIVTDDAGNILASYRDIDNNYILDEELNEIIKENADTGNCFKTVYYGYHVYMYIFTCEDYYITGIYPCKEADSPRNNAIAAVLIIILLLFVLIYILLSAVLRKYVIDDMKRISSSLTLITEGDLNERVDVHSSYEFDILSNGINSTVNKLKELIGEAEARIDAELAAAKAIQENALPAPAEMLMSDKNIGLYARMATAKEVGGDFYDYYMTNDGRLALIVADVSGKGIPAAMFMMRARTAIKERADGTYPLGQVLSMVNEELCENNDTAMFVTVWIGFLDLESGKLEYVNAGHTRPVLIRQQEAKEVDSANDLFLGGFSGEEYRIQQLELKENDMLFLYTDGVTEAVSENEEMYGDERLLDTLADISRKMASSGDSGGEKAICEGVISDIREFAKGAPQADDITVMCLEYHTGNTV